VDTEGVPVHAAEISIGAVRLGVTDARGRFLLEGLPEGHLTLSARRLGFRPTTSHAESGATSSLRIVLEPLPLRLSPVRVETNRVAYSGRLAGFYRRLERRTASAFILREQIDRENPRYLSHLFGRTAGVGVGRGRMGMSTIRFRGRSCAPLVWLDGAPMPVGEVDLDAIAPQTVHGVELYLGGTGAPVQYQLPRNRNDCGTILLWSRGPDTDPVGAPPRSTAGLEQSISERALFTADQVDEPATLAAGVGIAVEYPASLFAARQGGTVVAEFVVGVDGRVEPASAGIAVSSEPLLSDAVLRALRGANFRAARRQGVTVRQLVHHPFVFVPPLRQGDTASASRQP
jgi:TonB family protein